MSKPEDEYSVSEMAEAWLTKMRGEDAGALQGEFTAWLAASPEHREAYGRIASKLTESAILKASRRHGTAHAETRLSSRSKRWMSWGALATAAALLAIAYGAGGASLSGPLGIGSTAAIAAEPLVTRRGEIRSFQLADGSTATLDTDSRLEVSISPGARHVRLAQGRARLAVAADPRPFKAEVGGGIVTTHEGAFDIDLEKAGEPRVTLLRGRADIGPGRPGDAGETSAQPLPARRSFAYRSGSNAAGLAWMATEAIPTDWPSGWAEYRAIELERLVAEANRYAALPILIDERAIARTEVTGRFKISDTEAFADRIAGLLGLSAVRRSDGIHLRKGKISLRD